MVISLRKCIVVLNNRSRYQSFWLAAKHSLSASDPPVRIKTPTRRYISQPVSFTSPSITPMRGGIINKDSYCDRPDWSIERHVTLVPSDSLTPVPTEVPTLRNWINLRNSSRLINQQMVNYQGSINFHWACGTVSKLIGMLTSVSVMPPLIRSTKSSWFIDYRMSSKVGVQQCKNRLSWYIAVSELGSSSENANFQDQFRLNGFIWSKIPFGYLLRNKLWLGI